MRAIKKKKNKKFRTKLAPNSLAFLNPFVVCNARVLNLPATIIKKKKLPPVFEKGSFRRNVADLQPRRGGPFDR